MTTGRNDALVELARERQEKLDAAIVAWRASATDLHLWCGPQCGNCCSLAVTGPGLPLPSGAASTCTIGTISIIDEVRKASSARVRSVVVMSRSSTRTLARVARSMTMRRVMPGRMPPSGAVSSRSPCTTNTSMSPFKSFHSSGAVSS